MPQKSRTPTQQKPRPPEFRRVSIDDLRFDPSNPRIADMLGENPTQTDIEQLLLSHMKARELVPSFTENGYIVYEPLIIHQKDDGYVVVEGNRRLAAIRSMRAAGDKKELEVFERYGLEEVPCLIFTGTRRELLAYLGLRHLSKTKDWSANAKAAFVERILNDGHDLKEAARLTNTTTPTLRLNLLVRRLLEEAEQLGLDLAAGGAEGEIIFWHLGDAIRRIRTKAYLGLTENPDPLQPPDYDQTKFEFLIGWLYGNKKTGQPRRIDSIRDIKILDECLGNERAIRALESGDTLRDAREEMEAAGGTVLGHLDRAKRAIQRATGAMSDIDAEGLEEVETRNKELTKAAEQFSNALEFRRKQLAREAE